MSRLLPRLLADKEYFEMSQGLLDFRLQSDLVSTQKKKIRWKNITWVSKLKKLHLGWKCSAV